MGDETFTAYFKRQTTSHGSSAVLYEAGDSFPHRLRWENGVYQLVATDAADNSATYQYFSEAIQSS